MAIDAKAIWATIREPRSLLVLGSVVGVVATLALTLAFRALDPHQDGYDTYAYWILDASNPYTDLVAPARGVFLYSPVIAVLLDPLGALPWPVANAAWATLQGAALAWMVGPLAPIVALVPSLRVELTAGNVNLFIAAAIVAGFRWPALWAFPILTKVTPVVGVLWFVARREWRAAAIALGVTGGLALVSFALAPGLWWAWLDALRANAGVELGIGPVWLRWPLGALLTVWAARTDRRWVVPIAVTLSLGHPWIAALSILTASLALALRRDGVWPPRARASAAEAS